MSTSGGGTSVVIDEWVFCGSPSSHHKQPKIRTVRASPHQDLFLSVLVDGLLLVQTLQGSVMTLIELPTLGDGNPHETSLFQYVPKGANGALQERRESDVNVDFFGLEQLSRFLDFFMSLGTQRTVVPPGEFVFQVPCRFSVTHQNERVLVGSLDGGEATERTVSV